MPSSTLTDPKVLDGWGARGYNWEYTVSGQHQLAPRVAVNGGWYRRSFGNQTVTVDNRYNFANNSYDGRSASTRRSIRTCPTAAATRCAACTT